MIQLFAAVFVASLLGSPHCAGMCGPFAAVAVAAPTLEGRAIGRRRLMLPHVAYNGGRLVTYITLGAIAGTLGKAIDLGASAVGIERAAALGAAGMMILFGVASLLRSRGVRVGCSSGTPKAIKSLAQRGHRAAASMAPTSRSLALGMLTTLLPCGWLYAFVITAAGTAHPAYGAGVMLAFWGGTLPIMLAFGAGVQRLAGPLRARLPLITSLALIAIGVLSIALRLSVPAFKTPALGAPGEQALLRHVGTLEMTKAPCCNPEGATR